MLVASHHGLTHDRRRSRIQPSTVDASCCSQTLLTDEPRPTSTDASLDLFRKNTALALVKKCMDYEVEGARARPRGRPKKTWTEIVGKGCQARGLNREDATDRIRWIKQIKDKLMTTIGVSG